MQLIDSFAQSNSLFFNSYKLSSDQIISWNDLYLGKDFARKSTKCRKTQVTFSWKSSHQESKITSLHNSLCLVESLGVFLDLLSSL